MPRIATTLTFALLTGLVCLSTAIADSGAEEHDSASRINAANAMLREGKVNAAIESYRHVQPSGVLRDELNYNLAVAEFRKGEIESASALFTEAAAASNAAVASRARYNLGNCLYSEALQQAEQDKTAAIASLGEAISHYRGALRVAPNMTDARANIELAGELLRRLQEQQIQEEQQQKQEQNENEQEQKQQQNQGQDQTDQQQSDQPQSDQPQQGEQNTQSDTSSSQNSDSNDNNPQQSDQQEQSDAQNQSGQQDQSTEAKPNEHPSETAQENQSDSHAPDANQSQADQSKAEADKNQGSESGDESSDNQSEQAPSEQDSNNNQSSRQSRPRDMQSPDGGQPEPSQESDAAKKEIPSGELSAAGEQDASGEPTGAVAMADPNAQDGVMSKEEALKMLQAVRDRDMLRRLRQEQLERSRHVPVDRDW